MPSEDLVECSLGSESIRTVNGVRSRIREIMLAMEKETWLPMALRSMAVEGFMAINSQVNEFGLDLEDLSLQVNSILHALFSYGEDVLDSEVANRIQRMNEELGAAIGQY